MKYSTALKRSKASVRLLVVVVPAMWALYFWMRDWVIAVIAALMSIYLVFDAWNLVRLRRAARQDPEFLEKNIPGS